MDVMADEKYNTKMYPPDAAVVEKERYIYV